MEQAQYHETSKPGHDFEARVNALTRVALDAIIMMDAEGRITDWNPQAEVTFGWSREEAMGRLLSHTIVPLRYQEAHTRGLRRFLETGGKGVLIKRMEIEAVHRDGREFPVDLAISAVHSGGVWTFVAFVRDTSVRKRVEEALAEETEALYSLMDSTPDSIYFKDVAGRFTRINRAHARALGISSPLQALGKTDADFFDRDFAQAAEGDEQQMMQSGTSLIGKVERVRPNGGAEIWYSTTKVVLKDSQQRVAGILGISRDITQLNRVQEKLQASNEELEQRDVERTNQLVRASEALCEAQAELARVTRLTAMGELAASIAHELRQPLAGAVANSDACMSWLSRQPPDLDEARAAADRTTEAATRASDIIGRLQALFVKAAPERLRVNINEVIEETLCLIRSEVLRNNVSLQTELDPHLPPVLGDRVQLQQVVLNLVKNGIEAMSGVQDRALQLRIRSARYEANQIVVAVADSGAGIDPQALGKIFEPFYTTKRQGTGMGLAISRSIIEAHGGHLWAEPNTPRGATFQYTLPADIESGQ